MWMLEFEQHLELLQLPNLFFISKQVRLEHKKVAYEGLILNILLYGCESWSLTESLRARLEMFHNRCIRAMCRVTRKIHQDFHVRLSILEKRLDVLPFGVYLARRRLRWAGCVARMDFNKRLPRKLLSSWFPQKRAVGRPQMAYGHGLKSDLKNAGICVSSWHEIALDEDTWDEILLREDLHIRPPEALFRPVGADTTTTTTTTPVTNSLSSSSTSLSTLSYAQVVQLPNPYPQTRSTSTDTVSSSIDSNLDFTASSSTLQTESSLVETESEPSIRTSCPGPSSPQLLPSSGAFPPLPAPQLQLADHLSPAQSSSVTRASHCKNKIAPRRSARVEAQVTRRSSRIAAQSLANGGRRMYSNIPQIIE